MKNCFCCILVCFLLISCSREPTTLYVLETTDIHGELGESMSSTFEYIKKAREQYGDNLIVLDCGDNLQGTPEMFYSCIIDTSSVPIFADIFNALSYDALALGNHDFESGEKLYTDFYSQIKAPVLCANIVDKDTHAPIFKPYTILHKSNYKIAVLGMVSTEALEWLPIQARGNTEFLPMMDCAKYWVKTIYKKEHPDVVIGLFHTGSDDKDQSSAYEIAKEVSGIHLICCGHIHRNNEVHVWNKNGEKVTLINPDAHAQHIAQIQIDVSPGDIRNLWKTKVKIATRIISMINRPTSEEYNTLVSPFLQKANEYFNVPICYIDSTIYSRDALRGPCAWNDMLHHAYRKMAESMGYVDERAVNATIVSPAWANIVLRKGELNLRDIISIYPYNNTLSIVEMRGSELKDYLEYCYSLVLDYPDNPIYMFDTASGFYYTVDKSKLYGNRITILGDGNGNNFYDATSYRVAMNTFRASGGNGHLSKGIGWSPEKIKARTLAVSEQSIQKMLLSLYAFQTIDITPLNEWYYR